jgi:hypothetical protein
MADQKKCEVGNQCCANYKHIIALSEMIGGSGKGVEWNSHGLFYDIICLERIGNP